MGNTPDRGLTLVTPFFFEGLERA